MSLSFMEGNEALTGGAIADVQRLGPSRGRQPEALTVIYNFYNGAARVAFQ